MNNSRRNSTPSKPDQRSASKPNLQAGRDKLTGQVAVMSEHDRASYSVFVQAFVDDFQPRSAFARQLARRLGEDNWRLNRFTPSRKTSSRGRTPVLIRTGKPSTRRYTTP